MKVKMNIVAQYFIAQSLENYLSPKYISLLSIKNKKNYVICYSFLINNNAFNTISGLT